MSSPEEQIRLLKSEAITLKKQGDQKGALEKLQEARNLEFCHIKLEDVDDAPKLKQLALYYKQQGDLDSAKRALLKSKQLAQGSTINTGQQSSSNPSESPAKAPERSTSEPPESLEPSQGSERACQTQTSDQGIVAEQTVDREGGNDADESKATKESSKDESDMKRLQQELYGTDDSEINSDIGGSKTGKEDNDEGDMKLLQKELYGTGDGDEDVDESKDNNINDDDMKMLEKELYGGDDDDVDFDPTAVTFAESEMLDLEMMTEFKVGGLGVPSQQDYESKIAECKQKAVKFKQAGDKSKALEELRKMKQLQVVMEGLSHVEDGLNLKGDDDEDQWLEELNQDDHTLMRELFSDPAMHSNSGSFDLQDLAALDEDALKDAVELGMDVPSPEDVFRQAEDKRVLAIQLKRSGDLKGAHTALTEFKGLKVQAERLDNLLNGNGNGISGDELEALLNGDGGDAKPTAAKPKPVKATLKSSAELKEEAVRLRDEKKIQEATAVLKQYKAALQREKGAEEKQRCDELVGKIRAEIEESRKQVRLYDFLQRFDADEACKPQKEGWTAYSAQCSKICSTLESKGSAKGVQIERKSCSLRQLQWSTLPLAVQRVTDESEERLEVAVTGVREIAGNKSIKKIKELKPSNISIAISIQLPQQEEDSGSIDVEFVSSASSPEEPLNHSFGQTPSQFISIPRGDSRLAKNVLRRMERRKIQIQVHHVLVLEKKAKGFFSRAANDPPPEPTYLGRITLDLKDLLTRNCIAGEYPLTGVGNKAVGGILGLCFRTGVPFDKNQLLTDVDGDEQQAYEMMSFMIDSEE